MMDKIELVTQPETTDRIKKCIDKDLLTKIDKLIANDQQTGEQVDFDGFKIPEGKIPLDGNFSTNEIKELVALAKSENLISDKVVVKVLEENGELGDKVVIMEEPNDEKDHEKDHDKDHDNDHEKDHDNDDKQHHDHDKSSHEARSKRKCSIGEDIAKAINEAKGHGDPHD